MPSSFRSRFSLPQPARRASLLAACLVLLSPAAHAQAEILFVLGSDTSTPGIRVDRYGTVYPADAFDTFASPTGQGYRIMDTALRERYRDSYGAPLKLTWWMQGGSLYRQAENTNVPLGSTLPTHLMYRYHREALRRLGDEMTFHYHPWAWTDYDGDRRFYWNQARSFDEVRGDFDRTLAEHLIEEDLFPVSFRSGWHYMDDRWQARLDSLLPFSLHNDWPSARARTAEPIDNVYDWRRAPREFVPYRPSQADYQRPGGTRGWNTRSLPLRSATEAVVRGMFEAARAGARQVPCLWSHLADADFVAQVETVASTIARVAADYPDVRFRYATAVEAMQRWRRTDDRTPPAITVEEVRRGGGVVLRITSDEPLFQPVPFVALLDRHERFRVLATVPAGPLAWETSEPFDPALAAHAAVAATDTSGNVATRHLRYLPDDVYADNADPGYRERAGVWTRVEARGDAQVWGRDARRATLVGSGEAAARWTPTVREDATYHVFVRLPDDGLDAAAFRVVLRVDGVAVDSVRFQEPPPPAEWTYAGTARFRPGSENTVELIASAEGQQGRVLTADAVKLSAKVTERRLTLSAAPRSFGDVAAGDTALIAFPVGSAGTGAVTITRVSSRSGVLSAGGPLPLVLGPQERGRLPLLLRATRQGEVQDTLVVESDDPVAPVRRIPYLARVLDAFVTIDDADPSGYEEVGPWATSVTEAYGSASRYASADAPDGTAAAFTGTVARDGVYAWAVIVPPTENAAVRARYALSSGGRTLGTFVVDQNAGSGTWRALGLYALRAGEPFRIGVAWADRDQPSRVLRTDAARLFRVGPALQERVVDNDADSYREEGTWSTSSSRDGYGPSSRFAAASTAARARFQFRAEQSGMHGLSEIVPITINATPRAIYQVARNGAPLDVVLVDQNEGSGAWRFLGAYWFAAGDDVTVEVAHRGAAEPDRVLRADAVRFSFSAETATTAAVPPTPGAFALGANRPNPVRDATTFGYTLAHPADVRIRLFDTLGREVARVVEARLGAGSYTARFDATGLPSGLYLCRMDAGGFVSTRTWIVIR